MIRMLRTARVLNRSSVPFSHSPCLRTVSTQSHSTPTSTPSTPPNTGRSGRDISDSFASLAGKQWGPLDSRFASIKQGLIKDPVALQDSWNRLIAVLRDEIPLIKALGSATVPTIDFKDLDNPSQDFTAEHKKRGVAVIRNVLPPSEALSLKQDLRDYISANPQTAAFPKDNPQVYELYWSPSQLKARAHPNLLKTQRFLMSHFNTNAAPHAPLSTAHPVSYADRLRMRLPGDAKFALGPHVDGGSCERWESEGYGNGGNGRGVYDAVFEGRWEDFDPWDASRRLDAVSDLYQGAGACSMFRMYQGWLGMSSTGPFEGTLLVNPLLGLATSYFLLRPFFEPIRTRDQLAEYSSGQGTAIEHTDAQTSAYLSADNWRLCSPTDSWLHGATPGHGQELRDHLHPHLQLNESMVHIPRVEPGDYVAWHCDSIHAVDSVHAGKSDSSVLYIPACPLTETNAKYLVKQRECFVKGVPSPDFPGGVGESEHRGRWHVEDLERLCSAKGDQDGLRGMGLEPFDGEEDGLSAAQKVMVDRANTVLGFY